MEITTIEDIYEYQVKQTLKKIYEDNKEDIKESGQSFADWTWDNKETFAIAFHEGITEYLGEEPFEEFDNQ